MIPRTNAVQSGTFVLFESFNRICVSMRQWVVDIAKGSLHASMVLLLEAVVLQIRRKRGCDVTHLELCKPGFNHQRLQILHNKRSYHHLRSTWTRESKKLRRRMLRRSRHSPLRRTTALHISTLSRFDHVNCGSFS